MSDVVRCYECGRVIDENNIVMKEVSTGFLGLQTSRKPFHIECWKEYHKRERKKTVLVLLVAWSPVIIIFLIVLLVALLLHLGFL